MTLIILHVVCIGARAGSGLVPELESVARFGVDNEHPCGKRLFRQDVIQDMRSSAFRERRQHTGSNRIRRTTWAQQLLYGRIQSLQSRSASTFKELDASQSAGMVML